jgi:cytochrome b involved in lipid metabolism
MKSFVNREEVLDYIAKTDKTVMMYHNMVLDLTEFKHDHPGLYLV